MIVHALVGIDELGEFMLQVDRDGLASQHDMRFLARFMYLHIDSCCARTVAEQRGEVRGRGVIKLIGIDGDGDTLDALFFHGLQVLYVSDFEVNERTGFKALSAFRLNQHRASPASVPSLHRRVPVRPTLRSLQG